MFDSFTMKKHYYKSPVIEDITTVTEGVIATSSSESLEIPEMIEEKLEWE